jgi:hypothetical protein
MKRSVVVVDVEFSSLGTPILDADSSARVVVVPTAITRLFSTSARLIELAAFWPIE